MPEKTIENEVLVTPTQDCVGCALYYEASAGGPGGGGIPSCKFSEKIYCKTVRQTDGSYPQCPMEQYETITVKTVYKKRGA
jgi:hypothetical protein